MTSVSWDDVARFVSEYMQRPPHGGAPEASDATRR